MMAKPEQRRRISPRRRHAIHAAASALATLALLISAPSAFAAPAPSAHPASWPRLGTLKPGTHPLIHVPTKVNLVFVGYERKAVDMGHLMAGLPKTGDPIVRFPALLGVSHQSVGLRYDYNYAPRFADKAFDDRFFGYLSTAGFTGRVDPISALYNQQPEHSLTIGPTERYIDAASTERWLEQNARSQLGIAPGEDTVFLINWYGRPGFQFHVFTQFGHPDPDTGRDAGNNVLAAVRAWGGSSGPTWFLDLSADPVWWDNSFDLETGDFDQNGQIEYRLPPIWDYGNTTAYRPFTDLSGDLAIAIRYAAVDTMFGPSPIYDPAASVPPAGGAKQIALDIFEGDPNRSGLNDVHPAVVLDQHRTLEPYYPVDMTVDDRSMNGDIQNVLDIEGTSSPPPGCWTEFNDPTSEPYCFFRDHRSEYFPPANGNFIIPVVGFSLPAPPEVYDFSGSTDHDAAGKPAIIQMFDIPLPPASLYAYEYTIILTHEAGHFVGLSHRHDGYDSTSGVDFTPEGPTNVSWLGDESATVMSYLPGVYSFDTFDVDNVARWQVGRLLDLADTDAAAIEQHPVDAHAAALLKQADAEFHQALAAMHPTQWVTAATHAVAGYRDIQLADAAVGVTPMSEQLAAAQSTRAASGPASPSASVSTVDTARSAAADGAPLGGSTPTDRQRFVPRGLPADLSLTSLALGS